MAIYGISFYINNMLIRIGIPKPRLQRVRLAAGVFFVNRHAFVRKVRFSECLSMCGVFIDFGKQKHQIHAERDFMQKSDWFLS